MKTTDYSEDALIEQPAIELFGKLRWETANCFHEFDHGASPLGRDSKGEVVLVARLRAALKLLNPKLPTEAIDLAIEELTRGRSTLSAAAANREIYRLLKDGVKVTYKTDEGEDASDTVRVIDWNNSGNNDFFLASQFWIMGEMYERRADLIGFVNGLPLVFIELKAAHKAVESAYQNNLCDYRDAIPHVFWYNAITILSNGSESRIGSMTAEWEHFAEWKRINDEGEKGIVSLETMIRGTCEKKRLLDVVENFTLFEEADGRLVKKVAKNHQYLGVNNALNALVAVNKDPGKLGVFWHTQGSGKSISMVFFAQKVMRTVPGNWTFVIVTDRKDLDKQIYKNFANVGAVTEKEAHAESGKGLQQLLKEDHRYVFTLIQKFGTEKGQKHPKLSDREDIIVMTDEAHRSQYDTFALNMRNALPNASFIGFTGTPLMKGEEKTRQVFGEYVSIYNYQQSTEDGSTVPLFYENRIPELQLTNQDLNEDIYEVVEGAELNEDQEKKLEREFARQYHLITRDDRLEKIAADLVEHFMGRGEMGKAMVVSIDKATAVKMYDKVQKHWKAHLAKLRAELAKAKETERPLLENKIRYMQETDMAVVVSQAQNEIKDMKKKGVNIAPHRKRMVKEDLSTKFKNDHSNFRIVFVCAMWMTGFDVPSCSTIYLDKPMRNHTLMQTIARANRVFGDKVNGLIVDYVGVFRDLQKALAIYAPSAGGVDRPVKGKGELVALLKQAIDAATEFCAEQGINPQSIISAVGFARVKLLDEAVAAILLNDETKRKYRLLAEDVARMFKAVKPDPAVNEFLPLCVLFAVIDEKIRSLTHPVDISSVMAGVEQVLDKSIAAEGYIIEAEKPLDLSKLDVDKLKAKFAKGRKQIEAEKLRGALNTKLQMLIKFNRTRMDYLEKFQKMIDEYNAGSSNVEEFFKQLIAFTRDLNEEEKRGIAENLSEEELAIFDLLTRPEMKLSKKEEQQVKKVVKDLIERLKTEKFVLDWRKRQQSRAAVRVCIEETLDQLPRVYTPEVFQQKCELTYQHVYDAYFGSDASVYRA
ncbi:MAG: type I restriction endonuclease subunit R [Acidobacteriota bacterium]|nr:type I restriction endonuclease subunit R [Acidobacteriota bacterium]